MSIMVTCKCGKSYKVKDQFAGHETNCPYCGKPLKIPSREEAKGLLTNQPPTADQPSSEKETNVSWVAEQRQAQSPSSYGIKQAKSADSEDKEICANCGRQMPRSEQACVFNGKIVCTECDKNLRSRPRIAREKKNFVGTDVQTETKYKGVRGWLLLLCIILTILNPLGNFAFIIVEFIQSKTYLERFPGLQSVFVVVTMVRIVLTIFAIYAGHALWTVKKNAVNVAQTFFGVLLAFAILTSIFQQVVAPQLHIEVTAGDKLGAAGLIFSSLIWSMYLKRSKRVRATYPATAPTASGAAKSMKRSGHH